MSASLLAEPPPARRDPAAGFGLLDRGMADAAGAIWRDVLDSAPNDVAALLGMGKLGRLRGDHAAALDCFELAVMADPSHLDIRAEVGGTLLDLGRTDSAKAVLDSVLLVSPSHRGALAGMARAARLGGNRAAALGLVERALACDPGHTGLRLEAGHDLLALGRLDEAEATFRSMAADRHRDMRALMGLGHVARGRDDRATALEWFRAALNAAPGDTDACLEVAAELTETGAEGEALEVLEQVLASQPRCRTALMQCGHLARRAGDRAAALAWFQRAAAADPSAPSALTAIAEEEHALGRPREARRSLAQALAVEPDNMAALLSLADQAWLAQDFEECLALARRAMAAHPTEPQPVLQACRALMDLRRTDEALAVLDRAGAALDWPTDMVARKAEILRRDGQWELAGAALALGAERAPRHFGLWVQRMLFHITLGECDAADRILIDPPGRSPFERGYVSLLRGQVAEARWQLDAAAAAYRTAIAEDRNAASPHAELARVCLLRFDLAGCEAHQTAALHIDAGVHMLRRQSLRATSTHVGQLWDEFRMDSDLGARLAPLVALPPGARTGQLRRLLRDQPDCLAPAILLLVALRQAGSLEAAPPLAGSAIPRRIIQFWDTPEPPDDLAPLLESWPAAHPAWDYRRFDLDGAGDYLRRHHPPDVRSAFRRARQMAQKADIFRLGVLAHEGGVWVDADDRCLGTLDPLVEQGVTLAGWQESLGAIGNNLLAAVPAHPVIVRALALAVAAVNRGDDDIAWLATGPGALTRALAQEIAESPRPTPACLAGIRLIERGDAARLAAFHCFAAYKLTRRHWLRAAFAASGAADGPMA
jgi:tetratricopeptide (TPR) repeat protein